MRLHDYLEFFAKEKPDHPYAEMDGVTTTYAEADRRANCICNGMLESGLEKGDRFSYLSKNSIDMAIMYFAASKAGIVPVPLNYRLAPREWLYIINDAESKALFCEQEFVAGIDSIRDELSSVSSYIVIDGSADSWIAHDDWLSEDTEKPDVEVSEDDQLYQMYTSGTTGLPKGVMLSQRAIDCNMTMIANSIGMATGADKLLIVAPMYHAAAGIGLMTSAALGNTIVVHRDFDPVAVVESLCTDGITTATLVPAMIQACLVGVKDIAERQYPDLRVLFYGASPIAQETLREAMNIFGCDFFQGFGMTETTAMVTGLSVDIHKRALAGEPDLLLSAGRAVLGTEIRIVDDNDIEVERGMVGEIVARGPQLMMGYWNQPEATEKALKGGWMHTGDAAYMDEEGFIYIQDRIKDMIVSGGENIYPAEIESALFEHPAVADAAVIGIPSEQWGESVLAFLLLKPGETVTTDELIDFCRPRLAGFKIPRKFEFLDEIPRNASGKVLKKDLREPYWEGVDRRVG